jgi:hypothetical protein
MSDLKNPKSKLDKKIWKCIKKLNLETQIEGKGEGL